MTALTSAPPRILRLAANTRGRDFVIGDVHGAYNSVLAAMKAANFNGERDRLFSVGDLIDRGPDSWRCARFLAQPYIFAIPGNHEDMLMELYQDGEPHEAVLQWAARHNGFGWWLDISKVQRQEILAAVRKLPSIIELETPRGTVGLVHGDVPAGMDWPTFIREIEAGNPEVLKVSLWGRERVAAIDERGRAVNGGKPNEDGVAGIGRVFVGHTPQWDGLQRYGNVYAIDTGAIFGEVGIKAEGRLTFADVACKTSVLIAPRNPGLLDVREDPPFSPTGAAVPFGAYARTPRVA